MKSVAKLAITFASIIMGAIKFFYPSFVDWISFALFLTAIFPWIIELIERIELLGAVSITLRDVKRAADYLAQSKSYQQYQKETLTGERKDENAWDIVDKDDPALAVVAMAIDMERAIRRLADNYHQDRFVPFPRLLDMLQRNEILDAPVVRAIKEFWKYRNAAVHGARVDKDAADMAISVGRDILAYLRHISAEKPSQDERQVMHST